MSSNERRRVLGQGGGDGENVTGPPPQTSYPEF